MEVYLNSIEFGPGIYGAEAASQRFFKVPASRLTPTQAARMAAMERPVEMMARLPAARQRLMAAAFSGEIRLSM